MKLFVLDETIKKHKITNTPQDEDDNTEDTDKESTPGKDHVRWWLPFDCGKVGTLYTNEGSMGMGCGSRACLKCHRKKLTKSLSVIGELKKYPKSTMYSLVFTPKERIKNHEDVDNFLRDFRAMLRKWQRTHGMHFGYWVAETVVKDEEPPTEIICPIRTGNTPRPTTITNDIFQTCVEGGDCIICKGKGYLPSTHLHIHLVICCKSFYFGEGEIPEHLKPRRYHDFGGDGFYGFVHQFDNLGKFECQIIKDRKGMGEYIAKACLVYLGKGQKGVDWAESQRGCMIASYTYGKRRHRGACGDAYGYKKTMKDYTNFIQFGYHPPKELLNNSTDAFYSCYEKPRKSKEKREYLGRYIDVMTIGKKAQKDLPPAQRANKVLNITELDNEKTNDKFFNFIDRDCVYIWDDLDNISISDDKKTLTHNRIAEITKAPTITSNLLSSYWRDKQVVKKSDVWFMVTDDYLVFGKGSTMLSVPSDWLLGWLEGRDGGLEYLESLMYNVRFMPYDKWIQLLYYPHDCLG
jgi:hypothetical protein